MEVNEREEKKEKLKKRKMNENEDVKHSRPNFKKKKKEEKKNRQRQIDSRTNKTRHARKFENEYELPTHDQTGMSNIHFEEKSKKRKKPLD